MVKPPFRLRSKLRGRLIRNRWLYLMLVPGIIYFLVYKYLPMWGVIIAFMDYQPFPGFAGSHWVGFKHFHVLFSDPQFWMLFRNTTLLAVCNLVFYFPLPILIAIMLNEIRKKAFKRLVQTMLYVPHFVSWVVVVGIVYVLFSPEGGIVNEILARCGGNKLNILMSSAAFRPMIVLEIIWKEAGWGTIIFLAALSGIDPQLYESAKLDGANRLQQISYITLPLIRSTIIILFILRLGHFLDTGFEQIYLSLNATNRSVGEVFDTYVFRIGIQEGRFSYSTAVGFFKSAIALLLVVGANFLAKKSDEDGVF